MNNVNKILEGLNEDQVKAVKHIDGACYVTAGPGSGKTKVIVSRARYMIENGIKPENIVLFTFTNKAANEIKERIISFIGETGNNITVGTYHSICCRILRQYASELGYIKSFSILDQSDSEKIIKKIADIYRIEYKILAKYISDCKTNILTPDKAARNAYTREETNLVNAYKDYQKELKERMSMDFDDLILNTILLLEKNNDIKTRIVNKFKYIMADEFHDSSKVDLRLIKLLSSYNDNLCMIFDDYQSIYRFRGANVESVINFKDLFNDVKLYNLSKNYRSTNNIVEGMKSVIKHNKKQINKKIEAARNIDGDKILVINSKNQNTEYYSVIATIKMMLNKKNNNYSDIAILYRTGAQSRNIEQALIDSSIPYKIVGGTPFFTRMEVQDVLSYIKLIINPSDISAFERCINTPKRGLGDKTVQKIITYAREEVLNGNLFLEAVCNYDGLTGKAKEGFNEFKNIINDIKDKKLEISPSELISFVIERIGYIDYLNSYEEDPTSRFENLIELKNAASSVNDIEELIEQSSLYINNEKEEDLNRVNLMTMHSSKGLEFKTVIIIDAVEGLIPHFNSLRTEEEVAEERRLFYVGGTRAKDNLFIFVPKIISRGNKIDYPKESRFVKEINTKYKLYM